MASLVDSTAHFEARLREVGLGDPFLLAIQGAGVNTLSNLAFAVGQPGQPLVNADVTNFLQAALTRLPTLQEVSAIKRVAFEAQTFLVATLRQQVERDDTEPRKIPFAERSNRMQQLQRDLTGVSIQGELEPSHGLLEKVCAMYEQNVVRYFEPSCCVSRALEVQGTNKNKEISLERGSLVVKNQEDKLVASTDSEIKLHYAFVRRALAFQFGQVMSFDQHSLWETFLFEAIHREAPPGYLRPGLSQVLQCDRAAWSRLASTVNAVRRAADGTYPLGISLLALRQDPSITLYLAPLAKPTAAVPTTTIRDGPYEIYSKGGKGKGKGKGKKGKAPPMPQELRGKFHRTAAGDPLCFAFNTAAGCSHPNVKPGERCPRGYHLCMEPKCQKAHSLVQHKA